MWHKRDAVKEEKSKRGFAGVEGWGGSGWGGDKVAGGVGKTR